MGIELHDTLRSQWSLVRQEHIGYLPTKLFPNKFVDVSRNDSRGSALPHYDCDEALVGYR